MSKETISEDYFEFMLKKALDEYAEEEGKYFQEQLESIEEPILSEKYKKSIKEIRNQLSKDKKYKYISVPKIKVAAIALIVMFSGIAVTYNIYANYRSFINKLFTKEDTHISITYNKSNLEYDFSQIPESWEYFYIPEYMCAGYKVGDIEANDNLINISYINGENTINFGQRKVSTKLSIDNEHSKIKEIDISGYTGYIQKHESLTIIYWNNDSMMFDISGNVSDDELISIAESIYIVDDKF